MRKSAKLQLRSQTTSKQHRQLQFFVTMKTRFFLPVGELVGEIVGAPVGDGVGASDGDGVAMNSGDSTSTSHGLASGPTSTHSAAADDIDRKPRRMDAATEVFMFVREFVKRNVQLLMARAYEAFERSVYLGGGKGGV